VAVTTTGDDIILAAMGKSSKNRADSLANKANELLGVLFRSLCYYFSHATEVDPAFFGDQANVPLVGGVWAYPEVAEAVYRIEKPDGTEVAVVPFNDKTAEPSMPAIYRLGRGFRSAGNVGDPVAGDLIFYYGKRADRPANTAAVLDPLWVEAYNELPILDVARYLAKKDGRQDELAALDAERAEWLELFENFVEHNTLVEVRRFGNVRKFNSPRVSPV
jgi:hypothetical protein